MLSVSQLEVVVDVHDKPVLVARPWIELVPVPPPRWTVIERAETSGRLPDELGDRYAVCPSCRERVPLSGRPSTLRCRRCSGVFEVGRARGAAEAATRHLPLKGPGRPR